MALNTQYSNPPKSDESLSSSSEDCSICMDRLRGSLRTLECSHAFHSQCIETALNITPLCPLCRNPAQPENQLEGERFAVIPVQLGDNNVNRQLYREYQAFFCRIYSCYMVFITAVFGSINIAYLYGNGCRDDDEPCNSNFNAIQVGVSALFSVSVGVGLCCCVCIIHARNRGVEQIAANS